MIFTSAVKQFTTNKDFLKENCEENYHLRVKHEKWRHFKYGYQYIIFSVEVMVSLGNCTLKRKIIHFKLQFILI